MAPAAIERDWSDLPVELIHLISKNLSDLCDFIRFRAVCPKWCSSAPLSDPPPQLPWLLEYLPYENNLLEEGLRFYSLSTGKTGVIHVEESHRGKFYRSHCHSYLLVEEPVKLAPAGLNRLKQLCKSCCSLASLTQEQNRFTLFNPLTGTDNISLPPFPYHQRVKEVWPVWTTGSSSILSWNIVMDPYSTFDQWMSCCATYHLDKKEWILTLGSFCNSCYRDGMFFAPKGEYTIVYAGNLRKYYIHDIPSSKCKDFHFPIIYLIELSGVVTRVCWYFSMKESVHEFVFHVYKLNFKGRNEQPCWVELSNIDDHILFLDQKNGFSLKPIPGFKGNCIYFFHKNGTPWRYDIVTHTFQKVLCPFNASTWFVPRLH